MSVINAEIRNALFALRDEKYRDFSSSLIPNIDKARIIGVRNPQVRELAREFFKRPDKNYYLDSLPHFYYEENNLHAVLLENEKDIGEAIRRVDELLPHIDNWATCDILSPKVFKKNKLQLLEKIKLWMLSDHVYTVRFGIEMLMSHFLDEAFAPEQLGLVSAIRSEEYYVKMMQAWYFATALAKQYDAALEHIKQMKLDKWTHNKSIQKARESYRITPEQKEYLNTLKIK